MNARRWTARLAALSVGFLLAACGGSDDECSIPSQNRAVYDTLLHWYLWYQELPVVDPASYPSPEALLAAVTYKPLDRFSYITTQAEEEALFGASQFVGLGFRTLIADNAVWATDVFEGAPAAGAGLLRGSLILAVDGVPIEEVLAAPGGFAGALGPPEVGYELTLDFRNPDGEERSETLAKDVVTIPPVTAARSFELAGVATGYLVFRNFVLPGVAALDEAFAEFEAADVRQLIVDLRYNGGGLVRVMEHFASLLGSRPWPSQPFASYRYNDKNTASNETFYFVDPPPEGALALERLVFITTGATASAAETLVNGMPPYVSTATVGAPTYGKPVGQLGFLFCEKVLRPVSFQTVNSLDEGDYFDGIPVDCAAGDTLERAFGTAGEASFDAAVFWLEQGFCPPQLAPMSESAPAYTRQPPEPAPWRINDAH
jgi:carboxyl-terminal processing protease